MDGLDHLGEHVLVSVVVVPAVGVPLLLERKQGQESSLLSQLDVVKKLLDESFLLLCLLLRPTGRLGSHSISISRPVDSTSTVGPFLVLSRLLSLNSGLVAGTSGVPSMAIAMSG